MLLALLSFGHEVVQIDDQAIELPPNCVLWIMDNANWFPRLIASVRALPQQRRPLIVIWHWEPLPHPTAAGSPRPRRNLREWVKVMIGDPRATDLYTNHQRIAQLARQGIPDILAVCSFAWHEFLRERGIESVFVPIGHDREDGEDLGLTRDLSALFLGSLEIPRRKRMLKYLRKQNVDVYAKDEAKVVCVCICVCICVIVNKFSSKRRARYCGGGGGVCVCAYVVNPRLRR